MAIARSEIHPTMPRAHEMFDIIEQQVIPEFYDRCDTGIPHRWLSRIRESMGRLTPVYSANRAVREYAQRYYVAAAKAYKDRSADGAALAHEILAWKDTLERSWDRVRFGPMQVQSEKGRLFFQVRVDLSGIKADAIRIELFANDFSPVQMTSRGDGLYTAEVLSDRSANDFTARVIPRHPAASIPLEMNRILWQK